MKKFFVALLLLTAISACFADSRVYTLVNPHPEEVLQALRNTYGDKISADIVRGKLLVVGSKQQLDEVGALLLKLDPAPRALRLTVRQQAPETTPGTVTYSSDSGGGYTIDTVEGALVALDYSQIAQQPKSIGQQPTNTQQSTTNVQQATTNGWWVMIDNVPTQFTSLTLQIQIEGGRRAIVLVSYAMEKNQERRVFGNTVVGDLGTWIPLLPRPAEPDDNTISSGPKRGEQLYVRINKILK